MRGAALVIGLCLAFEGITQWLPSLPVQHWARAEGLPIDAVTALAKDDKGYLWVGTTNGLFRFDGRRFEPVNDIARASDPIAGAHITALLRQHGVTYVGTKAGAFIIDAEGRSARITVSGPELTKTLSIRSITAMRDGALILGTEGTTNLRITKSDPRRAIPHVFEGRHASIASVLEVPDHELVFCENGSGLVVPGRGDFGTARYGNQFPYPGHTLTALHALGNGLVLGTGWDNALHFYDLQHMEHRMLPLPNAQQLSYSEDEINCSVRLPDGRFAIGTKRSGVFFYNATSGTWSSPLAVLPGTNIRSMLVDAAGLWLGTEQGLYRCVLQDAGQQLFNRKDPHADERVTALFVWPDGRIGAISNERVWRDVADQQDHGLGPFSDANGELQIHTAFADSGGHLFLGSQRSLHRLEAGGSVLRHVARSRGPIDARNIASSRINTIAERKLPAGAELIWSAFGQGCFSMDALDMEPVFAMTVHKDAGDHLVRKITVGPEGRIWLVGANKGLVEISSLEASKDLIARYRSYDQGGTIVYPGEELCAVRDWSIGKNGTLLSATDGWDIIAAKDGGYWHSAGGTLYRFRPEESSPFSEVLHAVGLQGLTLDHTGRVWGIASGGLVCFDPATSRSRTFSTSLALTGLTGYPITDGEGNIWATNDEALLHIDPDTLLNEQAPPLPRFAALSIFDQRTDSLLLERTTELAHDRNFVFITPSVLDPAHGRDARFRYRLSGDDRWMPLGDGERIALTGLTPDSYTLELGAARHSNDTWTTTTWSFTILPPWWRSWWFTSLLLMVVALIIVSVVHYRSRQRAREQALRDRLARDLHDDIGSTLGSISYFSALAQQQLDVQDTTAARSVMERMGERSREMIGRMSDIVWSVDPKNDGGAPLAERMKLYAAETLGAKDIALDFRVDQHIAELKMDMVQRREVFLVLKEAVNNAMKHADCKRVGIALEQRSGRIELTVRDDGRGIRHTQGNGSNGNGLISMHKRAAAIGGVLSVEDEPGGGTCVRLSAPLRSAT